MRRAGLADLEAIKSLINDPAIRPTVGRGTGELDPTVILSDPRNICLFSEDGGGFFGWHGPRIFEGHSFFRVRGRAAIKLGRDILAEMQNEADLIWGVTPLELRLVRWFNRQLGFASLGEIDTPEGRCELFEMRF